MPSATISIRAHVWLWWARIAVRQEQRAHAARREGVAAAAEDGQFAGWIGLETDEAIQAVAAARHAIHNQYRVWRGDLGISSQSDMGLLRLTAKPYDDPAAWQARVKKLIGHRDEAVHHNEMTTPAQPHPGYPTNVSGPNAMFTAERATEAVDVLLEDVLRPVYTAPSEALASWAANSRHLMEALDKQRSSGPDYLW